MRTLSPLGTFTVFCAAVALLALPIRVSAGTVTLPYAFQNGNVADADQVNANFAAVKSAVDDNAAQIEALTSPQLVSATVQISSSAEGGSPPVEVPLYSAPSTGQFVVRYSCFESRTGGNFLYANIRVLVKEGDGTEYPPPATGTATSTDPVTQYVTYCNSIDPGYVLPSGSQLVCWSQVTCAGSCVETDGRCWVTGELRN